MNYKTAQNLRRTLAVHLMVSILSSPLLLGISANAKPSPPTPFDEPTEFIRRIPLTTNDLVYSSSTGKIYTSVPSRVGSSGNSITAINPTTGVIDSATFVGSEPNKLALSDDGHSLYVSLDGSFAIRRFNVLTNTPGVQFTLGQDQFSGRLGSKDLAVAPGNPNALAVVQAFNGFGSGSVAIFDNGVRRPNLGFSSTDFIAFSASASKLYGTATFSGLQTMTIDASGVAATSSAPLSIGSRIKFSNGKIFTSSGQVINPDTGTLLGTFSDANSEAFVPDTTVGRAYYVTSGPTFGTLSLKAFDINTFLPLGSLTIPGVNGTPTALLRWGPNGLAFRTNDNQLFIIQTSLIPSAEPIPTPTPTPSPTPSPSPSPQAPAFVRQISLTANDLVADQGTQKLYVSVPSSQGSTGNSIAEIDPALGSITHQTFIGSEPTHLAQADDGATLYVGLDGAASIRRYNILTHVPGSQFFVGRHDVFGPYTFGDIAVSPGNPSVVAVARQFRGLFPPEVGVTIFDNGVPRVNTGPGHLAGSNILAFASPSLLYGNGGPGLNKMAVDSSGVTVTGTAPFSAGNQIILANNLLYGSTGQVLNPTTDALVGTFSGVSFEACHAIDIANGRAFFLSTNGSGVQLRAFDLNTFLPLGFVNISGAVGTPRSLVRWGTNGLAFRTTSRQVFLIETALVNSSVPVASPTPTPSPTPSPSPLYIPTFVRRVNLPANNIVYSEATQALYASVPSTAGVNGNSITKIIPETGAVGPSTFIGSEPNRMAISSDGQTIWVHLNGANAVRRFDINTQTAGTQFNTSSQPPLDMKVVPGSPQSLVLSRGFPGNVAVFDNGVQRPNVSTNTPGPIEFGAAASTLYGSGGNEIIKYLIDGTGIAQSTTKGGFWQGGVSAFKFSNGLVYGSSGVVADPETAVWKGTFLGLVSPTMVVDSVNQRTLFASSSGSGVVLTAFDSNTFRLIGTEILPGVTGTPGSLLRWGTNGLALNTSFGGNAEGQIFLVQTRLVSNSGTIPTGIQLDANNNFASEGTPTLSVKVVRTGDVSGTVSVNYATSNGTATAGSDYTSTSGTLTFAPGELSKFISIPISNDNLFENANETFNITLSGPTGTAVLSPPSTGTVTIFDNDSKPLLSGPSSVRVTEGDSGTKNFEYTATLSNPTVQVVTVNFATANVSATAGGDYVASSGTLTIPAGSTTATTNIVINGDTIIEPDETFNVTLTNPTNVNFVPIGFSIITIANDDAAVQLSSNTLSVSEAAGFVNVAVTRAGDTSRAATVLYSTTDTAGLQSCTVANSKASERCDYATSVGRVQFAIGETTKTITIPIVDDVLVEGAESFTLSLNGPVGALLGAASSATITITDNDAAPASQNPIDGVTFFVTQQYIDFLGRLPDTIGLANWTNTLGNCPNGGFGEFDNPSCDRVHVSSGFFLSEEFRGRGYWAYKFYEVGFDRRPTYGEFVPDMAQVGGAQSPQSEVLSKAAYLEAFVQRPEFKSRYDGLNNAAYVGALETNAEVTLSNKAALIEALNGSQKTRAEVLREIVELQAVEDKFFIRAFVAMQYFGYLRRDPDTIGYNNWVTTLTANPSDFRHMIFGFLFSNEYRQRFGP